MLALTRKQMMVLLIVLVAFVCTLFASMAVIHATNPTIWQNVLYSVPNVISHF